MMQNKSNLNEKNILSENQEKEIQKKINVNIY